MTETVFLISQTKVQIQLKTHKEIQEFKRIGGRKKDRKASMKMLKNKTAAYFNNNQSRANLKAKPPSE